MPTQSIPPRRSTKEEMRLRIMTTADALCRTLGYGKMTVADIASEIGISPAYVYKFFSSKQSIIEACADQRLIEKKERILHASRQKARSIDRLEAVLKTTHQIHVERFKSDKNMFSLIIAAHQEKWACIRYFREFLLKLITDIVEEGVRRKEFRPADPLDTARVLLDSFAWITHPLLFQDLEDRGIEERIRAQLRLLEKALT
ncbi:transcriptional regulator, TetR family [Verrucomicrobium sp. GAS474]|uniref:TetR/AcrR family transcriptional regulator n=1 Tax=Verrucomicrobium sp. GAS474 TaxID=1882831 RepID=UPI000879F41E|nr:TetR/AcrR family transcriptional regulator [Verrucomicrobium sp. GAS474]SDU00981.1 transcriptional regulator, TetR family [Verrucomicrobium sp. GAS474]